MRRVATTQRTTLAQVAARAGVNPATASQVLNGRKNCWASEATRRRIREAARALGYRPNLAARSLRSGRTMTVGLITTALWLGSARNRINGLDEAAGRAGYAVMMTFNANSPEVEDKLIRRHLDRGVDGLVIYSAETGEHTELRRLVERGFPVVTLDGADRLDFECDDVSPDYLATGRLQARHLLDCGRRRVCIGNATPAARINDIREEGVRRALADAGAPAPTRMNIVRPGEHEIPPAEVVYGPVRDYVAAHLGEFDAVVAYDSIAALTARALLELGARIPEDVAIVGAGNSVLASYGVFPLTTVETADLWIGQQALDLLLERIGETDRTDGFRRIRSQPRLIVRESTVAQSCQDVDVYAGESS